jgi:hypothetical protein
MVSTEISCDVRLWMEVVPDIVQWQTLLLVVLNLRVLLSESVSQ